jgi:HK97 family phage major capsid protein
MPRINTKKFCEETIGACVKIIGDARLDGRDEPNEKEWAAIKAYCNIYSATTGRFAPTGSADAFLNWSQQNGMTNDDWIRVLGMEGNVPSPSNRPNVLVDRDGRRLPVVAAGESFAAAVRAEGPSGEADEKFANYMDDGLTLGSFMRALLIGPQNNVERAAISSSNAESAGFLVPKFMAADIIDAYRAQATITRAGATMFQMQASEHSIGREVGVPAATWTTETGSVSEAESSFGTITFRARNLRCVQKFSRNWAEDVTNGQNILEQSLAKSFAQEVDRASLFGNAVLEPSGLSTDPDIQDLAIGGTLDGYDSVLDAVKLLDDNDVPDPTGLILSTRERNALDKLKDGEGRYMPRPQRIANLPFYSSSKIPNTGTTDAFLGVWPDFYIGTYADLRIELLRELYAETHQFGLLCYLRMDCGTVRPKSFVKLSGITG